MNKDLTPMRVEDMTRGVCPFADSEGEYYLRAEVDVEIARLKQALGKIVECFDSSDGVLIMGSTLRDVLSIAKQALRMKAEKD